MNKAEAKHLERVAGFGAVDVRVGESVVKFDIEDALMFVGVGLIVTIHGYVRSWSRNEGKEVYVHRLITGAKKGEYVDHIDGDKLNNVKSNLRICTNQENSCNARLRSNNKSGVKGVYWSQSRMKWTVQITFNGKTENLGRYSTLKEATEVRHRREIELQGDFSALNGVMSIGASNEG